MRPLDFNSFADTCLRISKAIICLGLPSGLSCLLFYWLPAKRGVKGYTKPLLFIGLAGFIGYLSLLPLVIQVLESCQQTAWQQTGMIGVAVLLFISGILALPLYFLPSIIAFREKSKRKRSVLIMNCLPLPLLIYFTMLWLCLGFSKDDANPLEVKK